MSAVDASSFRKLTHREHVLLRPEMYIGSVATEPCAAWVVEEGGGDEDPASASASASAAASSSAGGGGGARMVRREALAYSPGLLKVFDEIVVNAIDHSTRTRQQLRRLDDAALKASGKAPPAAAAAAAKGGARKRQKKDEEEEDVADTASQASGSAASSTAARAADFDRPQVVKKIMVSIDRATGVIEVANDGDGIPVEKHSEHGGVYVPELIFGHLLTSANYDDAGDGGRVVGGQNGIGAKACNILSEWFEIEVVDRVRHLRYRQKFERNMEVAGTPKVERTAVKKSATTVRFLPDYKRLGMPDGRLSDDMRALMVRRVWDATAVTEPDVAVWLDGKKLEVKSFERYVDLYVPKGGASRSYERPCDGWEIAAALSDGTGMQQVSFVNGVATLRGGRHVDHVVGQICRKLCDLVVARRKGGAAAGPAPKPQYVRDNLIVFVRATVPGPRFDSQSKETLTTPPGQFGGKVEVSDAFVDRLYKIEGLVDRIVSLSGAAADKEAKKSDGAKRATVVVPKLDDAEWAGTAKSDQCTLILTEGDSAKASAVAGLSVVGRQKWGVFPLRGKVMNVCDVSADKIGANAEISAIKKILGLQNGKVYTTTSELRYGRVMLMTDADLDGSHIKALVMNLFQMLWPSLLKIDGFLCTLLTPIVKVWPTGKNAVVQEFYCLGDFKKWTAAQEAAREAAASASGSSSKAPGKAIGTTRYYKGLGSSSADEARDWFKRMRLVAYTWDDATSRESLQKAFDKKRADDRKEWLRNYDAERTIDYGSSDIGYSDFVEHDLVHFSIYDVLRSIPSAVDGLKISQRKALFGCRKRNLYKGEVRVAQLAAYASEHSCFHHGEASMQGTLITMAQSFVGSGNNAPLLEAIGQFGTRLTGGDDSASPRYIHTRLSKLAALMFPKEDDATLEYLDDDGVPVEPKYYLPVLPLVLLNGGLGIGTGFSTNIPSFNPLEVVQAVREWLAHAEKRRRLIEEGLSSMTLQDADIGGQSASPFTPGRLSRPWHRGFVGTIEETPGSTPAAPKLRSRGVLQRVKNAAAKIRVSELPLGLWTEDFKTSLETLVESQADVKSYSNESTDCSVDFTITFTTAAATDAWMASAHPDGADPSVTRLEAELKMVGTKLLSTSNMHLFNAAGQIKKYATPLEIVEDFCVVRLEGYVKRKSTLLVRLRSEAALLRNRVLFLEVVADGRLVLQGKKGNKEVGSADERDDTALEAEMEALGLERRADEKAVARGKDDNDDASHDDDERPAKEGEAPLAAGSYKYLLGMPMASMTVRRKEALDAQLRGKVTEIVTIEARTPEHMWAADLDALTEELTRM